MGMEEGGTRDMCVRAGDMNIPAWRIWSRFPISPCASVVCAAAVCWDERWERVRELAHTCAAGELTIPAWRM